MDFAAPVTDWLDANKHWILIAIVIHFGTLGLVGFLTFMERKVAAWVQDRVGPNRTTMGFGIIPILKNLRLFGLAQPAADGIKFFTKEDYRSPNTDRVLFTLAPAIMIIPVILSIAVIPWGGVYGHRNQIDITRFVEAGQSVPQILAARTTGAEKLVGEARVYRGGYDASSSEPIAVYNENGDLLRGNEPRVEPQSRLMLHYTQGWFFQIARLNIGVLFVLAALGLAVYGVVVGGYASNNKYSFLGGLRATANMISYEIPLGLSVLVIVLCFSTLDLSRIVELQAGYWAGIIPKWNVFSQPLAFILFLICIHAEANRAPFDTAEAEQELVGGYHTEYSSMRFALFFLAEYAGMITTSAVCVALFFGGWHIPWVDKLLPMVDPTNPSVTDSLLLCLVRVGVYFAKTVGILFIFMWVRWSLPRFRFDQILSLAWKNLIPISLALVIATGIMVYVQRGATIDGMNGTQALTSLVLNLVILLGSLVIGAMLPKTKDGNKPLEIPDSRFQSRRPVAPSHRLDPTL